jgi:hypothetical protein
MPESDDFLHLPASVIARMEADAQSLIRREAEAWLVEQCRETLESSGEWTLDYSSPTAYEASCKPHRKRWSETIGEWTFDSPFNPLLEPCFETKDTLARWLRIDLADGLQGRAILARPKNATHPLPWSSPSTAWGAARNGSSASMT